MVLPRLQAGTTKGLFRVRKRPRGLPTPSPLLSRLAPGPPTEDCWQTLGWRSNITSGELGMLNGE